MVWCSVVWHGVVWCGVVWCGVVWHMILRVKQPANNNTPNPPPLPHPTPAPDYRMRVLGFSGKVVFHSHTHY